MQVLLDFLSLVGVVLFVMVLVFALWEVVFAVLAEVLWYVAMGVVFYMLTSAALSMVKAFTRFFGLGFYKRC